MSGTNVVFVPFRDYDWGFYRTGWLAWNPVAYCLIASFCAVAYWMCLELLVLVFVTFKRRTGLYFWSIIVTTIGLILQTTGYILVSFENSAPRILVIIICKTGWVCNVTGFSIVLWSRLHLVVNHPHTLRYLLILILVNGFLWHTPVIVLDFGLMTGKSNAYYNLMQIFERIQQMVFTLQETLLSSLYIYYTHRFLNVGYPVLTRRVIWTLIYVQVLVVALDTMLTTFDYLGWFKLKFTIHSLVYAIKLKLEFIVLNQLQSIIRRGLAPGLSLTVPDSESSGTPVPSPSFITSNRISRPLPAFDCDFITKTGVTTASSLNKSPGESSNSSLNEESTRNLRHDSNQALQAEQHLARSFVDDVERRYMGRWDGSEKS